MSQENSKHPRRIGLVDCNNFYASCERVFNPSWNKRPVGVLSNNDGCIVARSNELKAAGIPMGAPYFQYKEQLDKMKAIIVSSNYTLYGDMSSRVMSILGEFTPELEIYSIDEAWLDFTGFDPGQLDAHARKVVATTTRNTGIPVSMGIASTKVLAKIANRICKKRVIPGGVFNLGGADALEEVLSSYPVGDIWGVGRQLTHRLKSHGIHTALHLQQSNPKEMRDRYSVVMERLVMELQGTPCLHFEDIQPRKQIIASRSFGQKVTEKSKLNEALAHHASRAGEKLRRQGSVCGAIQATIRTSKHDPARPYLSKSAGYRFSSPTSNTMALVRAASLCLEQIYQSGHRYAKAEVMLSDIHFSTMTQQSLFGGHDDEKTEALMKSMDELNRTLGRGTIRLGTEGPARDWEMKRERMTPAFTTRWKELPRVR